MKILFIGDIHHGTTRTSSTHQGVVRQQSALALSTLRSSLPFIAASKADLIVHMGDAIRDTADKQVDLSLYDDVAEVLSTVPISTIWLLGNHDLLSLSVDDLKTVLGSHGYEAAFSGVREFDDFQLVFLGLEMGANHQGLLPTSDFELLASLSPTKPTLICSHYSLVPWNADYNFYTRTDTTWMSYANASRAQEILSTKRILGLVSAHAHWGAFQLFEKNPCFVNPAFSENIAAPGKSDNNPGSFSTLSITGDRMIWKSFSGNYAFLNIEL